MGILSAEVWRTVLLAPLSFAAQAMPVLPTAAGESAHSAPRPGALSQADLDAVLASLDSTSAPETDAALALPEPSLSCCLGQV